MKPEGHDQIQPEMSAYYEMLEELRDILRDSRVAQYALAFVIEDMRQKRPDSWEDDLVALKDALHLAREQQGVPGLTWKLAQEIHSRYDAFLAQREIDEEDPIRKANLTRLRDGIARDRRMSEEVYKSCADVPIGGIILEHVPAWFQFTHKTEGEDNTE